MARPGDFGVSRRNRYQRAPRVAHHGESYLRNTRRREMITPCGASRAARDCRTIDRAVLVATLPTRTYRAVTVVRVCRRRHPEASAALSSPAPSDGIVRPVRGGQPTHSRTRSTRPLNWSGCGCKDPLRFNFPPTETGVTRLKLRRPWAFFVLRTHLKLTNRLPFHRLTVSVSRAWLSEMTRRRQIARYHRSLGICTVGVVTRRSPKPKEH